MSLCGEILFQIEKKKFIHTDTNVQLNEDNKETNERRLWCDILRISIGISIQSNLKHRGLHLNKWKKKLSLSAYQVTSLWKAWEDYNVYGGNYNYVKKFIGFIKALCTPCIKYGRYDNSNTVNESSFENSESHLLRKRTTFSM